MKKQLYLIITVLSLSLSLSLSACGANAASSDTLRAPAGQTGLVPPTPGTSYDDIGLPQSATPAPSPTATPLPTPTPFPERDIHLMAVGDNLLHMGVVDTGKQADGTYDYSFLFQNISPFLSRADIKVINQETILGGNELGFSGYPRFNSPTQVGDSIVQAGFNVVLHASNHAADKGIGGLTNCVAFWDQYPEVVMTGIHADEEDAATIPLLTVDDITFALLNYTYSPNASTIPESVRGHLDMLCKWDRASGTIDYTLLDSQVLEDIRQADELADVVIVFPHWGTEYTTSPSRCQERFALQMTEAGADLIIGTHPHVIQPVKWIKADNGNRALCFYSLGNYVSTQKKELCMLEALAWVTFHVAEDGISIVREQTGVVPMVCHYTANPVRIENIYLLEDYTKEQAAAHGILDYGGVELKLENLQQWSEDVYGDWILSARQSLFAPPSQITERLRSFGRH